MTLLLAISMMAGMKVGNASQYGYVGDAFNKNGTYACRDGLRARFGERAWQQMREHGVAHRTLPCGTPIIVCSSRTALCTTATVVDRGPYGALDRTGVWHVRTGALPAGERFRGELDLLPAVYAAIDLTGIEKIAYWRMPAWKAPDAAARAAQRLARRGGVS